MLKIAQFGKAGITIVFLIAVINFAVVNDSFSQSLNLRLNAYVYTWERFDSLYSDGSSTKSLQMRSYQNLLFDFSHNKYSLNFNFQSEGDITNPIGKGFDYRFYNLYFKGTNVFDALDFRIGRQYVFGGAGKGSIDGVYLKLKAGKFKEFQLAGFGGFLTPYDYSFKNYSSLDENYLVGGQLSYYGVRDLFVGLSYMNKHKKPVPYSALRLDSLFNTQEVMIDIDPKAEQLAGLDFNYSYMRVHNFFGKVYYDLNMKRLQRVEANARVNVNDKLRVSASYFFRQPLISYNSIFWVFQNRSNQEIEASADYSLDNGMIIYGRVANVFYENENSQRLQIGFNHPSYGFSYTKYLGYAGESDGVSGYYYRQLIPEILSGNLYAGYSNYYLGNYDKERVSSFTGMLGLTYRPSPQISIDAQGQFLHNRLYNLDTRFLIGVNYWFFNRF